MSSDNDMWKSSSEDTDEVPIDSQARAIMMRAAKVRQQAMEVDGQERQRLLVEADRLEEDALRMARGDEE